MVQERIDRRDLRTILLPELDGWDATLDFLYGPMRGFLEGLSVAGDKQDGAG